MLDAFKRGLRRLRQGSEFFDLILAVSHTQTQVVFLAHPLYAQAIREALVTQSFYHLQSILSRCSNTEVCHFDVSR